jgi:hypothetical protein
MRPRAESVHPRRGAAGRHALAAGLLALRSLRRCACRRWDARGAIRPRSPLPGSGCDGAITETTHAWAICALRAWKPSLRAALAAIAQADPATGACRRLHEMWHA